MTNTHLPVLLQESVEGLALKKGAVILDGTVGAGGHARALSEHIGKRGVLVGLDRDKRMLAYARKELTDAPCTIILEHANYKDAPRILARYKLERLDGALLDLGFNTIQVEDPRRGFSFLREGPLLMAYDAKDEGKLIALIAQASEEELTRLLREYGEERFARPIAREIVSARKEKPIVRTKELAGIILRAVPVWYRKRNIHPATKTFQAFRIVANDELGALSLGLEGIFDRLASRGRCAVISFHSLEDRIVKNFFRKKVSNKEGTLVTKKPILPSRTEIKNNPRARSAKLRIIQKL